MSFTVAEFHDLVRLVEERPEWRAELRRLVLTEELLALPEQITRLRHDTEQGFQQVAAQIAGLTAAQARTEEQMTALSHQTASLVAAQARTEEQMTALSLAQARTEEQMTALSHQTAGLVAAQARTEEQMKALFLAQERTEEQMKALSQAQASTAEELRWLVNWQRGEAGRRDGERYERDTIRRAPALFNGGRGGSPEQPSIQRRLTRQLGSHWAGEMSQAEDDPFLADIAWWKGEHVVIVEVSRQVDRQDVTRAERRARTLKQSGVEIMACVIGEQWATAEAREQAQARQVEWKVDADLSDGFLAFRRR
ncbi:MAG: hypothetical protein HYZ50_23145 [Deltaproteobacteria bacterium]|nr:hypothetical protein [Deltaproteobacteria bacterium]